MTRTGWGKWLRWRDHDGRIHTRHVTDAALQGDPASLCAILADEGLTIDRGQQRALVSYLGGCHVKSRVTIVHRTGWHEIGGHSVFVLPDKTIGPKGSERVILDASACGPYETRDTRICSFDVPVFPIKNPRNTVEAFCNRSRRHS